MKITLLFAHGLLVSCLSISMVSCSCHDEDSRKTHEKEKDEPGKVPPSPDIPEPPRNLGAPTS
jgi:hypothetical protein